MAEVLELEGVHTNIGQHHILQGVSLRVRPDAVTVLLGRNGAGKTTTMRTVMGVLPPSRGTVRFEGRPIHGLPPHAIARLGIGYVPEGQGIFATLTVEENLRVAMRAENAESRERMRRVLALFPDLERFRPARAGTLSGGQQQMLAIGRGLMSGSKLLLLDEPSLGLSPLFVKNIFEIIAEINRQGTSILLVEQNVFQSLRIANRAYVLETGRVVLTGSGQELLGNEHVKKAYLGI